MKTPEGKIKDKVRTILKARGLYWFMPVQTGYGKRTLDILVCAYGFFLAIETKKPGDDMSPFQDFIAAEMRSSNGLAMCVNGAEDIAELVKLLDALQCLQRTTIQSNTMR